MDDFDRPEQKQVDHFPQNSHMKKNTEASYATLLFFHAPPLPQTHFLCIDEEQEKEGSGKAPLSGCQRRGRMDVYKKQ